MLTPAARPAVHEDAPTLARLYRALESEMVALKPIWRLTDGLPEPVDEAVTDRMTGGRNSGVIVGLIDDAVLGFLVWHHASLLPQGDGASIAVIDLIFTEEPARRVGVGHAMIERFMADAVGTGITLFDAIVPPGHRHAKNFFEAHGFKARRITMHREDE